MKRCNECNEFSCGGFGMDRISPYCGRNNRLIVRVKKRTNFEKIKAMRIEEMANMINYITNDCEFCPATEICNIYIGDEDLAPIPSCKREIKKWLESEVGGNA